RYSPFSVTLAWVQVSPDRYHTTGSLAPSACGGTNTEKVIAVLVSRLWCRYTPCTPPCDRFCETVSMAMMVRLRRRGDVRGVQGSTWSQHSRRPPPAIPWAIAMRQEPRAIGGGKADQNRNAGTNCAYYWTSRSRLEDRGMMEI